MSASRSTKPAGPGRSGNRSRRICGSDSRAVDPSADPARSRRTSRKRRTGTRNASLVRWGGSGFARGRSEIRSRFPAQFLVIEDDVRRAPVPVSFTRSIFILRARDEAVVITVPSAAQPQRLEETGTDRGLLRCHAARFDLSPPWRFVG